MGIVHAILYAVTVAAPAVASAAAPAAARLLQLPVYTIHEDALRIAAAAADTASHDGAVVFLIPVKQTFVRCSV